MDFLERKGFKRYSDQIKEALNGKDLNVNY